MAWVNLQVVFIFWHLSPDSWTTCLRYLNWWILLIWPCFGGKFDVDQEFILFQRTSKLTFYMIFFMFSICFLCSCNVGSLNFKFISKDKQSTPILVLYPNFVRLSVFAVLVLHFPKPMNLTFDIFLINVSVYNGTVLKSSQFVKSQNRL